MVCAIWDYNQVQRVLWGESLFVRSSIREQLNDRVQTDRLCTIDPVALNYIFNQSSDFIKPPQSMYELSKVFGPGMSLL